MRRIFIAFLALFCATAAVPRAHADDDHVSFFHNISIAEGEEAQDVVCIFCSIHVDGAVHGDAVAIMGSIHSNGPMDNDAVAVLGNINLGQDAHVSGDCVAVLGSVRHFYNGQVGHELVQIPFAVILVPIFFFIGIVYLIRSLVWRARIPYPMPPPPPPRMR